MCVGNYNDLGFFGKVNLVFFSIELLLVYDNVVYLYMFCLLLVVGMVFGVWII